MVSPFVVEGKVTSEHINQSLPGLVTRLGTHSPSFQHWDEGRKEYVADGYNNVLDLSADQARWVVRGCQAVFVGLVVWLCRTPTWPRQGWRLSAEFGVVLLGMLLFSERTWKHHCVTQVLPFAVLCYWLAACRPSPALRNLVVGALGLATLLLAMSSPALLGEQVGKRTQAYAAFTLANVGPAAALCLILRSSE